MESLVVLSKIKKWIREKKDFATSAQVFPLLSDEIQKLCDRAIENAQKADRKTVLERDLPYSTSTNLDEQEILVVSSKVKNYIKDKSGLSTSTKVMAQLSFHLQELCGKALAHAESDKRKTVMDRDFTL